MRHTSVPPTRSTSLASRSSTPSSSTSQSSVLLTSPPTPRSLDFHLHGDQTKDPGCNTCQDSTTQGPVFSNRLRCSDSSEFQCHSADRHPNPTPSGAPGSFSNSREPLRSDHSRGSEGSTRRRQGGGRRSGQRPVQEKDRDFRGGRRKQPEPSSPRPPSRPPTSAPTPSPATPSTLSAGTGPSTTARTTFPHPSKPGGGRQSSGPRDRSDAEASLTSGVTSSPSSAPAVEPGPTTRVSQHAATTVEPATAAATAGTAAIHSTTPPTSANNGLQPSRSRQSAPDVRPASTAAPPPVGRASEGRIVHGERGNGGPSPNAPAGDAVETHDPHDLADSAGHPGGRADLALGVDAGADPTLSPADNLHAPAVTAAPFDATSSSSSTTTEAGVPTSSHPLAAPETSTREPRNDEGLGIGEGSSGGDGPDPTKTTGTTSSPLGGNATSSSPALTPSSSSDFSAATVGAAPPYFFCSWSVLGLAAVVFGTLLLLCILLMVRKTFSANRLNFLFFNE